MRLFRLYLRQYPFRIRQYWKSGAGKLTLLPFGAMAIVSALEEGFENGLSSIPFAALFFIGVMGIFLGLGSICVVALDTCRLLRYARRVGRKLKREVRDG